MEEAPRKDYQEMRPVTEEEGHPETKDLEVEGATSREAMEEDCQAGAWTAPMRPLQP